MALALATTFVGIVFSLTIVQVIRKYLGMVGYVGGRE